MRRSVMLLAVLTLLVALPNVVSIWTDRDGRVLLTDREPSDGEHSSVRPEELARAWRGRWLGEPLAERESSSSTLDRYERELRTALDDVRRGEMRTGLRALRRMIAREPGRPDAAWVLARIERARGRLAPAREALDAALSVAAGMPPAWREDAERMRRELDLELAHAEQGAGEDAERAQLASEHFRLNFDHHFSGRDYGAHVLDILELVRGALKQSLGRALEEPLEVRVYTRAQYLAAYEHRFGFATVGFYDGAIHVVSARQPRGELVALLAHEYAHALFQHVAGGHEPFFLNEGIAEREEERLRGHMELSRGEWRQLLDAMRAKTWVPLRSLVKGFAGLQGESALLAYLESRAAVDLIEAKDPAALSRWLDALRVGTPWERALQQSTGFDTGALEVALQAEIASRFPRDPLDAPTTASAL